MEGSDIIHAVGRPTSSKCLTGQDLAVVKRSDREQQEFRIFAESRRNFSEEERSALKLNTVAGFDHFWNAAIKAKGDFDAGREHGVGLAMKRVQRISASAQDILHHIEPVVELVRDFAAPYGNLAIGTMSFLFIVARNRAAMDDLAGDALLQIRDRVVGLRVYRHIYNDTHELDRLLQSKIIQAYESFVGFCMEVTGFYCRGRMKRWMKAAWGSNRFAERASEIQQAIVDVRRLSEELLSKNVDTIKQINIAQGEEIEALKAQIKDLQEGHNSDRLADIKVRLGLATHSDDIESDLFRRHEDYINAEFERNWAHLERMHGARLEAFMNDHASFRDWRRSSHSCMLILAGYNHDSFYRFGECWLSPVAFDLIARQRGSTHQEPLAFCILGAGQSNSLPQVLSRIILQLLMMNNRALQDTAEYLELIARVQEYRDASRVSKDFDLKSYMMLEKVALRVLKTFDTSQTVHIILDRVDRCNGEVQNRHRKQLLRSLVHLTENATVRVRVLAVVNGYDWGALEEQLDELGRANSWSVIFDKVYQRTLREASDGGGLTSA